MSGRATNQPGCGRVAGRKRGDAGGQPSAVRREERRQVKARSCQHDVARAREARQGVHGGRCGRPRVRPRHDPERGRQAEHGGRRGRRLHEAPPRRRARDGPHPHGERGHLRATREGNRAPERRRDGERENEDDELDGESGLRIFTGRGKDEDEQGGSRDQARPEHSRRDRQPEGGRDASDAAEGGQEAGQRAGGRIVQPGHRARGLREENRNPGRESQEPRRERKGRAHPASRECEQQGGGHRDEREVVDPERGGRRRGEGRQAPRLLLAAEPEEKDGEAEQRQERVGTGFRRVEVDEREAGDEGDPPSARPRAWQRARDRKEREAREKGEHAHQSVAAGRIGRAREGSLEQVEERRARVGAERPHQVRERHARNPRREDFVVPERSLDRERDAARDRNRDEQGKQREETGRRARSALQFGSDALF